MEHLPHGTGLVVFAAIVLYSAYRRFRSQVGRQPVQPRTMLLRMGLLGLAAVGLAVAPHLAPYAPIEELAGIAAGAGLALWGLSMTRFSAEGSQRYYTPNTWLGVAVSTLLIARIAYRFAALAPVVRAGGASEGDLSPALAFAGAQTGLTLALFGVVAGYYVIYYAGVLRRSRALVLAPEPAAAD